MITTKIINGRLSDSVNREVSSLHNKIFNTNDDLNEKYNCKNKVMTIIALKNDTVVGYKTGYDLENKTFYSWLGGVNNEYRYQGIGQKLMDEQIKVLKQRGYKRVRTKTFNRWKGMLLLNIKNDFQIIDCYKDLKNDYAIIMEKSLE